MFFFLWFLGDAVVGFECRPALLEFARNVESLCGFAFEHFCTNLVYFRIFTVEMFADFTGTDSVHFHFGICAV